MKQVTDGVWVHESEFLKSNAVVVQGKVGVLLIDPGITSDEMSTLADDLRELGQPVIVGYSTHPHWDHLLWDAKFGEVPRYGTVRGATEIRNFLSNPDWKTQVAPMLPPDIANKIPMDDLFGRITELPAGTALIPWDGPDIQIIEHPGHAAGSAALLVKECGVFVAGDMVSDILMPFLELDAGEPIKDYLAALQLFESIADSVKFFIPGHGSVGDATQFRARIQQDRAYVHALAEGGGANDPRITDEANKDFLPSVHNWQSQQIAKKRDKV